MPRMGSSHKGPFWQAHLKPDIIVSRVSCVNWMLLASFTRMFLCCSIAQTFSASAVVQFAFFWSVVEICRGLVSSVSSLFSMSSITLSSNGWTCMMSLLSLLGLLAWAAMPFAVTLSR